MEVIDSKQLDHHGLVAGVISDLGLQALIDERLLKNPKSKISTGQAVVAMLVNSLGFTTRPLSLTPHFFESKAVNELFGNDVKAEDFNRHRLGRSLDEIADYGCDMLYAELAQEVCRAERISQDFLSLDTTSHTVTGRYDKDADENEVVITHGYSKDHRPDLKQVVQELLVSQDGGIPLMSKSFDGNASDSEIFKVRCKELLKQFQAAKSPSYLVADSKLYSSKNAENLKGLPFITRIPRTVKEENQAVKKALESQSWTDLDEKNRYYLHTCEHFGMKQRWLVIYSQAAADRAQKTLNKHVEKEAEKTRLKLKHLRNEPFKCEGDAHAALKKMNEALKYHQLLKLEIIAKAHYSSKGRPKPKEEPSHFTYIATAAAEVSQDKKKARLDAKSCYVIGTNVEEGKLSHTEIIEAYKKQNESIERGFRFLKDPYFFTSSFFIKKPSRIMALLMIMTLALLVYSIAQRRLRKALKESNEAIPNQINQPSSKPTLRWVFQLLEGISVVYVRIGNVVSRVITGLTKLKRKIIGLFSEKIQQIYGLDENQQSGSGV